ncbi:MAG: TetR/AcrR family transcriptional regulator [Wenzhouxiangellaceae bacterium]
MGPKGQQTKQKILETAAIMFWKYNYHGITVDQIVEQAQVNKASFYQYFGSKENAAQEAMQYMYESTLSYAFKYSFAEYSDPLDRLESIFKRIYNNHRRIKRNEKRCPGCPFVNMGNELATVNEDMRKVVSKIFQGFHAYHTQIYNDAWEQGIATIEWNPKKVGRRMQSILNGGMTSAKIHNSPEEILDALDSACRLIGIQR